MLRLRDEFERLRRRRFIGLLVVVLVAVLLIGIALHGVLDGVSPGDFLLCVGLAAVAVTAAIGVAPRRSELRAALPAAVAGELRATTLVPAPAQASARPLRL